MIDDINATLSTSYYNDLRTTNELQSIEQRVANAIRSFDAYANSLYPACLICLHRHFELEDGQIALWSRDRDQFVLKPASTAQAYIPATWTCQPEGHITEFIEPQNDPERDFLKYLYALCMQIDTTPLSYWAQSVGIPREYIGLSIAPYFFNGGYFNEEDDNFVFVEREVAGESKTTLRTRFRFSDNAPVDFLGFTSTWRPTKEGWIQANMCAHNGPER